MTDTASRPIAWEVTNRQTGKVTRYKSSAAATKAQDRMDWAYGAVCTSRRAIWA